MSETETPEISRQSDNYQYPPPPPGQEFAYIEPRPRPTLPQLSLGQLGSLVLAAAFGNLAIRSEIASISSLVAVALTVGLVLHRCLSKSRVSLGLAAGALVFAAWLPLRASDWLTSLNAVAVVGLLLAAVIASQPLKLEWTTATIGAAISRVFLARFFASMLREAAAPVRTMSGSRLVPIVRGIAITTVPVLILGALLASADAVFAQSISIDVDAGGFIGHTVLTIAVAALIAGLVAVSSVQAEENFTEHRPFGATEALILLLGVGGLYAAFAFVQLMSALGRTDRILDEQGLTYAEYARGGFFQLLWVAGLTLILLGTVRLFVAPSSTVLDRALRIAGATVALLTVLIVAVAIVRLGLYTDEFGQTTLRWYCTAFAWMLGAAFVLVAVGHARRAQSLLPIALVGLVVLTLFTVNLVNPEARVAQHNLNRADASTSLDADYLSKLSADAWPELLKQEALVRSQLTNGVAFDSRCLEASTTTYGVFGFNLASARLDCGS